MNNNKELTNLYFNKEYRNAIRKNPNQTLNDLSDKLAGNIDIKIHTNSKDITYLVIPNIAPNNLDLHALNAAELSTVGSVGSVGSFLTLGTLGGTAGSFGSFGTAGTYFLHD